MTQTALITGASRGIGAVYAHVKALDYDFNLSKLERVMSRAARLVVMRPAPLAGGARTSTSRRVVRRFRDAKT